MIPITYREGDALEPVARNSNSDIVITHLVNDAGLYGAGFAKAVTQRYPVARTRYRNWFRSSYLNDSVEKTPFELGMVQIIPLIPSLWMAHLLAQHGVRGPGNSVPLDLDALENCLWLLGKKVEGRDRDSEVHMPRIGCGLAGGSWAQIEPLVNEYLSEKDIPVTVYLLV